jgi:hypothetical protein
VKTASNGSKQAKNKIMRKGQFCLESWMLKNGKAKQVFYSHKKDKDLTAFAHFYNRKIKTERLIVVSYANKEFKPIASTITKVTLL